jgi:hypothetical protein
MGRNGNKMINLLITPFHLLLASLSPDWAPALKCVPTAYNRIISRLLGFKSTMTKTFGYSVCTLFERHRQDVQDMDTRMG